MPIQCWTLHNGLQMPLHLLSVSTTSYPQQFHFQIIFSHTAAQSNTFAHHQIAHIFVPSSKLSIPPPHNAGLFKMIVEVLKTFNTQYT
jgi:hypothetical protein